MKQIKQIELDTQQNFKHQLIKSSNRFIHSAIFTSQNYQDRYGEYEFIAALDSSRVLKVNENSFERLKEFFDEKPSWLFGHFSYDLKNQLEKLESNHPQNFDFFELCFFEPKHLFLQRKNSNEIEVFSNNEKELNHYLEELSNSQTDQSNINLPSFQAKQTKREYIEGIQCLKKEIQYGNIYEINYCTEFFIDNCIIEPSQLFQALSKKSPMPFGSYYKQDENFLIGASPERFIKKKQNQLISQPIKGTARRGVNEMEDQEIKTSLKHDLKEQTENVMIVDLVRNDLSKTASKGSVQVEELFGVYSFPQVHQLISTISSTLSSKYHFIDAIKEAFPMGSMTGAPKISAMKLAEQYEKSRRELYSGSVGYITPWGDFDFNVVIRSLLYSSKKKYLSLMVGGAITNLSEAEKEYDECLLKAKAIFDLNKAE